MQGLLLFIAEQILFKIQGSVRLYIYSFHIIFKLTILLYHHASVVK